MNKKKKILVVLLAVILLTGCTKYKNFEKKPVTIPETGQKVVENILCKTDATIDQYENLKKEEIEKLNQKLNNQEINQEEFNDKLTKIEEVFTIPDVPMCNEFTIVGGNDNGLWVTVFVKTLSWLIIKIGTVTKNYGWAIILVTLFIRLALYPLTKKTAMQSENMQAAKSKLDKLEAKYRNRNDQESQMMKAQEMMKIYKDYNISPMAGCLFALIQIPLFFAFYEALYRLPVVLEENFFGINLGLTPGTAILSGKWYYIIFIILVIAATYFSFKLNSTASPVGEQQDQMKMMTNMSVIMISIASVTISSGIALYWIVNSSFTIIQNLLVKRRKKNDHIS